MVWPTLGSRTAKEQEQEQCGLVDGVLWQIIPYCMQDFLQLGRWYLAWIEMQPDIIVNVLNCHQRHVVEKLETRQWTVVENAICRCTHKRGTIWNNLCGGSHCGLSLPLLS